MTQNPGSKLAIVGAGSVGTSLAYAALIRGSASTVALFDVNAAKAEAEVLDLAHGTQFTAAAATVAGGGDIAAIDGADVVVITAGAKQAPGQTRLDLAGTNVRILEKLMPQLLAHAPDAVYVLVTNPCDVLTVAARQISGLAPARIFSSGTVLDTSRLRWLLARQAGVSVTSVHASMVGEHGDTEFPVWSGATIGPVPIRQWMVDGARIFSPEYLAETAREVMQAAYKVIAGKGATNYAIGLSGARIVEALLRSENAVLPVSTVLDGQYGISGVALSLPSIVGNGGVRAVLDTPMNDGELASLHHSAETLQQTLATLGI
ncbi:L-lactate dehydrogenase [Arthrobacter sp. AL08]|uniref:L-lactate dehydrogenase n=1 Tax=Micrococcaceae TaxID=1268 RepID=UPI001CFFDEA5|nr:MULTISPECIES: L-lactate dehydrogenase [Micrococcaceae]MCB5283239.1 L-lactate dehydrogenase 2 [Arthrobacter sp. ES1]MDI3241937.1 L-lactate dehydrogenase [Arthrobacter sp. AL05]MDI3278123.1 L-lactate dehydrogenase [Arthrobacter sp. AL08]MDJ0354212.1 L-lactate dehydrogenase [Pseudarthrobacter sp. PH31-O2]WGZ79273.1 L-lactate dehydrogenase [Arthrobacter sp. EM1]